MLAPTTAPGNSPRWVTTPGSLPLALSPPTQEFQERNNDAEAIFEATSRPSIRFFPVKFAEQRALLCLFRIHSGLTKEQTAKINQIRGLLAEFGLVMPKGRYSAGHHLKGILADGENGLPMLARRLLHNIHKRIPQLDEEILAYDREIEAMTRRDEQAKRLMTVPEASAIAPSSPETGPDLNVRSCLPMARE